MNKHKLVEEELQASGEKEIELLYEKMNQTQVEQKPSAEILNQNKILENLVKQKEYI
jgi:hypothetical protein